MLLDRAVLCPQPQDLPDETLPEGLNPWLVSPNGKIGRCPCWSTAQHPDKILAHCREGSVVGSSFPAPLGPNLPSPLSSMLCVQDVRGQCPSPGLEKTRMRPVRLPESWPAASWDASFDGAHSNERIDSPFPCMPLAREPSVSSAAMCDDRVNQPAQGVGVTAISAAAGGRAFLRQFWKGVVRCPIGREHQL